LPAKQLPAVRPIIGSPVWPKSRQADRPTSQWPLWPESQQAGRPTSLVLREPPPDPISEADLSAIWAGQRYPPGALTWPDGSAVGVVYPGRRGGGAGPDFRDAVVRIGGEERRGDVELHVRASYFLQHRHHFDPAYDGLVLHVVFADDAGGVSPLPGGGRVPVAAFAPWVQARAADIAAWVARPPLWREPCADAALRLGDAGVAAALRQSGVERFQARGKALERAVAAEGADEALWQALLETLGYGGDRDGFRRLARALPVSLLKEVAARAPGRAEDAAYLALTLVAGLTRGPSLELCPLPAALSPPLRGGGGRPANRAEARLGAAAALALRPGPDPVARSVEGVRTARHAAALLGDWTLPARPPSRTALLGRSRAAEVLVNAVLPLAWAVAPGLRERCLELAAGLAALPPYGKTLFLERNLAPPGAGRRVRSVLDQQGLLALHADWCSKGGCGRCPLS
jgi:hypothetical protein